jgi:hypothetical protein
LIAPIGHRGSPALSALTGASIALGSFSSVSTDDGRVALLEFYALRSDLDGDHVSTTLTATCPVRRGGDPT